MGQVYQPLNAYDFEAHGVQDGITDWVEERWARQYKIMPLAQRGDRLIVGMEEPFNLWALDRLSELVQQEVLPVPMPQHVINRLIQYHYSVQGLQEAHTTNGQEVSLEAMRRIQNTPIVQLVDALLEEAIQLGASDIHIEPLQETVRVRMRIDGFMQERRVWHKSIHESFVTRLKVMAGMNIAEKRLPQDGTLQWGEKQTTMRLATLPTVEGEKVAIRIFKSQQVLRSIETLGMHRVQQERLRHCVNEPSGLVLVTGPTGSGKSTTLYATLAYLKAQNRGNILTLEEPVETKIEGITQVSIQEKVGMTFEVGLKALLRQDPDIMMIGEIRDQPTARHAVTLALTGHLVLSTLHTEDVAGTIVRLMDMGIEKYLLAEVLKGIVVQRLVGKLCPYCKQKEGDYYKAVGCERCQGTGYKSRQGIYHIVPVEATLQAKIHEGSTMHALRTWLDAQYHEDIAYQVRALVQRGETSMAEYRRLCGERSVATSE